MKKSTPLLLILLSLLIVACVPSLPGETPAVSLGTQTTPEIIATNTATETAAEPQRLKIPNDSKPLLPKEKITLTTEPDLLPNLYGCEAEIEFTSGPLINQTSSFSILDKSYFEDKGDKFAIGKGTGIYYEEQSYLILHSSYIDGNILKPMEAELIRKHLEHWGNNGNEYIQEQINQLINSKVSWRCNDQLMMNTTVEGVVRLSHEASNRLWLEPTRLEKILNDKEGEESEWIGEMTPTEGPYLYLGFCGWGPKSIENGRYTYFRYLIKFSIQN